MAGLKNGSQSHFELRKKFACGNKVLQIEFRFNEQSTFGHTLFICGIISKVSIFGLGNFALLVSMDKNITVSCKVSNNKMF